MPVRYDCRKYQSDSLSFVNEITICERIISPVLHIVAKKYDHLKVWSHVSYNIDEQKGLVGEPDYLIAPRTKYGDMAKPSLCVIEAKRDDSAQGWAQALRGNGGFFVVRCNDLLRCGDNRENVRI